MKINKVKLHNFSSYEGNNEFDFEITDAGKNIVLIGGKNGAGKTSLFTAIKVALYGPLAYGYVGVNSHYISKIKDLINSKAFQQEVVESEVQLTLQLWIDGGELNVGATTKDVVNITKARDEINKRFLISAINWQIEGVSLDNLNRVKATKDFIGFERQKRAAKNALTILPADRETQGVLEAFLAYVTLGNGSWNFDNSAMMVYRVQTWLEKWKKTIIQTVNVFDNQ